MKPFEKISYKGRFTRQTKSRGAVRAKRKRYYARNSTKLKLRSSIYKKKNHSFLKNRSKSKPKTRTG